MTDSPASMVAPAWAVVCVAHCPQEAIELVRDAGKGEPLEIQKLIARAAESALS